MRAVPLSVDANVKAIKNQKACNKSRGFEDILGNLPKSCVLRNNKCSCLCVQYAVLILLWKPGDCRARYKGSNNMVIKIPCCFPNGQFN